MIDTQQNLASRFSRRNDVFGESIWTSILELFTHHEDPIYFGDGAPDKELIPLDRLREAARQVWAEDARGAWVTVTSRAMSRSGSSSLNGWRRSA
jgi:hypothetical protein